MRLGLVHPELGDRHDLGAAAAHLHADRGAARRELNRVRRDPRILLRHVCALLRGSVCPA